MSAKNIAMAAAGASSEPVVYVDDVFSTYLYTGTSSAQTISNGIDLAGKGGMVWIKARSVSNESHFVYDTARGPSRLLNTNLTTAQTDQSANSWFVDSFLSNGFTHDAIGDGNSNGTAYTSWTFRKAPKFFDVVTWTGNGTAQTIAHSLGSVPGCIIFKPTSTTGDWEVWHRSTGSSSRSFLNSTAAVSGSSRFAQLNATASSFNDPMAANGVSYVAYLFAHDTAADGLIQCGSFTTDGSGNATVNLGWEPQWLLVKPSSGTGSWIIVDNMRGMPNGSGSQGLAPDLTNSEFATSNYYPTATEFTTLRTASTTYIYVAIRRGPMKAPTSGTSVFTPTVYTGTNTDNRLLDTTIAPDMVWLRQRNGSGTGYDGFVVGDRLRGQAWLKTQAGTTETTTADGLDQQLVSATEYGTAFSAMNGIYIGNNSGASATAANINANTTANNHIALAFKRAPGFFDVVTYTGTGNLRTVSHNLGQAPTLMLVKRRDASASWDVYASVIGPGNRLYLNLDFSVSSSSVLWNSTQPTSSVFTVGSLSTANGAGANYIAYLFASVPGVSSIGGYTGNGGTVNTNGTTRTINCGFATGARFVLIKRRDAAGSWYFFDTARGITSGSDPHLLADATVAEASINAIDADSSGFIVRQTSGTNLNVTGATYLYFAIA